MAESYNHKEIEAKWQEKWAKDGIYKTPDKVPGKENFYTPVEFVYPSGNLHVGHWYACAVPDIYARYQRMIGKNVLYPIGFDSFGLPAENAAIKRGLDPKNWTYENISHMREQLRSMGAMFDWDREVTTSDPEYYKWTQWMFAKFFEKDLVYRVNTKVNWCPKDQTILANEQVVNGKCERCDSLVEQKDQDQWSFRITKYADRLHDDLDKLDWPEAIKEAQKNWIGRTKGAEIDFKVRGNGDEHSIKVFTTRPETIFGATFIAVSAGLAKKWLDIGWPASDEIKNYVTETLKEQSVRDFKEKEKTGISARFNAINPATSEEIPIWITNYVLDGVGTGAIMAVPAHDERDYDFAKRFDLPIKQVVAVDFKGIGKYAIREGVETKERRTITVALENKKGEILIIVEPETITLIGGGIDGDETPEEAALREIKEETGYMNVKLISRPLDNYFAHSFRHVKQTNVKTNDYLFHAILEDETRIESEADTGRHNLKWVSKEDVVKTIPDFHHHNHIWRLINNPVFTESGVMVNSVDFNGLNSEEAKEKITEFVGGKMTTTYKIRDWGISRQRYWGVPIPIVYDPNGKAHIVPEANLPWLLPTDVDHTPDGTAPLARSRELFERTERIFGAGWKPEVETMDTFVDSSWYFYRYLDPKNDSEFCAREKMDLWMPTDMYFGGAEHTTMHLLYSRFWNKALFDLGLVKDSEPYICRRNRGQILGPDGNKMSKSKGNVIDPDEVVKWVGADSTRMYLAFMGPYGVTDNYPWDPNGVVGIRRFLERVLKLKDKIDDSRSDLHSSSNLHKTIKKVTEDIVNLKFNTAISAMMILQNKIDEEKTVSINDYKIFLRMLAPFSPHLTEEIWHELGETESIHLSEWPKYDESKIKDEKVKIVIQINGKLRDEVDVDAGTSEEEVKNLVLSREKVIEKIAGAEIKKFIYVENKLANIVI